jgi:hypothetical protein
MDISSFKRKIKVNERFLQVYSVCDKLKARQGKIVAESRAQGVFLIEAIDDV